MAGYGNVTSAYFDATDVIAAGIRQAVSDRVTELGYHEPRKDITELGWVHDNAAGIAAYIMCSRFWNDYFCAPEGAATNPSSAGP
jgi:hypothetical protein